MPPIRSLDFSNGQIQISDLNGTLTTPLVLPVAVMSIANAENWINKTWIPAHITDYEMQVHVTGVNPLTLTIWTGNKGLTPYPNWWQES